MRLFARRSIFGGSSAGRAVALASALALCGGGALAVLPATAAAEECPNAAFRTGPSTHLPDCRAYELVSPVFTDTGAPTIAISGLGPGGTTALLEIARGAPAGLEGYPNRGLPYAMATVQRTASGWVATAEGLPTSEYEFNELSEGSVGLEDQATLWLARRVDQPQNQANLYLRRRDRSIVEAGPALPPSASARSVEEDAGFVTQQGGSSDMSHLLFSLRADLWPFDTTEESVGIVRPSLYEYVGTGNVQPMLVGVDDSGSLISRCGTVAGDGDAPGSSATSADGNTVFFTAEPAGYQGCKSAAPPVAELFARIDNGLPDAHTVAISEPSEEDCAACYENKTLISAGQLANAEFVSASEDGSKVFFATTQPLLGGDASRNIYEYDFDAPAGARLVRVSAGDATVSNPTAGVFEVKPRPVVSRDGSHVYFSASGVLTKTPNREGESAEAGGSNLYVFERDATYPAGHIAFVAQVSWQEGAIPVTRVEIETTPDGRFLVFTSRRDLTPDDTTAALQVFEYDAQTGVLKRVSIGQHGYNHNGNVPVILREGSGGEAADDANLKHEIFGTVNQEGGRDDRLWASQNSYWSELSVSADGSYVFFESAVGLTPQALNMQLLSPASKNPAGRDIYASNIYEYHDGQVSLVSDGQDLTFAAGHSVVELLGTDPSGQDVFFRTGDQLVGQDTNTNGDVYDARIDGGFPAPAPPPSCTGEACQGGLGGAPTLLSPGSEFQAGSAPPLAAPTTTTTSTTTVKKPKAKHKAKKRRAPTGRGRGKAKKAAVGGRERKAGQR